MQKRSVIFAIILVLFFFSNAYAISDEIIQNATKSTVKIEARCNMSDPKAQGSGVIIKQENELRVLTVWHVVTRCPKYRTVESIEVILYNNWRLSAEVIDAIEEDEFAVLRILCPPKDLVPAKLANEGVDYDSKIFTVGYPAGKRAIIFGEVVNPRECINIKDSDFMYDLVQTDMVFVPGHSGSPVFNEKGELLGNAVCAGGYFVYTQKLLKKLNIKQ